MQRFVLTLVLSLFIISTPLFISRVSAETVAVIINKDNPISEINISDIKKIYQDKMIKWPGGGKISIYNLPVDNSTRVSFSEGVLQKPAEQVEKELAIGYVPLSVAEKKSNVIRILLKVD